MKLLLPITGICALCFGGAIFLRMVRQPAQETTPMLDAKQKLERTCFQTSQAYSSRANLRSDVAIVYGIDPGLPARIQTWRDRGYRIHVMTGVSWGNYQDYLYGRFDGVNHEDEAQTDRRGQKISHGGDVYYMSPGENYGKFLCVGVQRALDAGAEAIHLEEPEFWARGGYAEGFKREWQAYYNEPWQPPDSSVDARWRASKLMYFLYRRALQQIFDHVQDFNRRTGKQVRCYVPTHSLINYAHWRIVSPESSLARINGCDGYIAQVWTGTSRTPNLYRGQLKERTFETAFLEYGAMQNLVRATGRRVWYLNDPIEDNPNHDWGDYRRNWESTLVASLLQPEVWQYEVMPWPERIFNGKYPSETDPKKRVPIPAEYETEVQTVINALNDMNQKRVQWDCGTTGIGILISDSLMFQRGDPTPSDPHMSHLYGLALPLLKRGIPVEPVQLENAPLAGYLKRQKLLVMTYQGMKPLDPEVHAPIADWVRKGGTLVFWDDDSDPYLRVREWWNTNGKTYRTPRQHLFEQMQLPADTKPGRYRVGKGILYYRAENPVKLASDPKGDQRLLEALEEARRGTRLRWQETNYLMLQRGPYLIAAGLDESRDTAPKTLTGDYVNLFDPELKLLPSVTLSPGSRYFLLDTAQGAADKPAVLASACKALPQRGKPGEFRCLVEGIAETDAVMLMRVPSAPGAVLLDGKPLTHTDYDAERRLLRVRFANEPRARMLAVQYGGLQ
jgi:hypothetical protein